MEKGADTNRIAETVVQSWEVFVEAGLLSPVYRLAKRHYARRQAAELALLDCYLRFCAVPDRRRLCRDEKYFQAYARLFFAELGRFGGVAFKDRQRLDSMISGRIRLLRAQARKRGELDRHTMLTAVFSLCSSEKRTVKAYARYREFQNSVGKRPPRTEALVRLFPVLSLEERLSAMRRNEAG